MNYQSIRKLLFPDCGSGNHLPILALHVFAGIPASLGSVYASRSWFECTCSKNIDGIPIYGCINCRGYQGHPVPIVLRNQRPALA